MRVKHLQERHEEAQLILAEDYFNMDDGTLANTVWRVFKALKVEVIGNKLPNFVSGHYKCPAATTL